MHSKYCRHDEVAYTDRAGSPLRAIMHPTSLHNCSLPEDNQPHFLHANSQKDDKSSSSSPPRWARVHIKTRGSIIDVALKMVTV